MYCICCKKNNVVPTGRPYIKREKPEEYILWEKNKRPDGSLVNVNNEMIDNGIIHIIDAGYGSSHDGDQFIIAICDDCIKNNSEDGTLLYYGNYMYTNEEFILDEVEKSKKIYRRRNNLDGLV
jgi:hypothetical protein